jgi:hypothetical protein
MYPFITRIVAYGNSKAVPPTPRVALTTLQATLEDRVALLAANRLPAVGGALLRVTGNEPSRLRAARMARHPADADDLRRGEDKQCGKSVIRFDRGLTVTHVNDHERLGIRVSLTKRILDGHRQP